MRRRMMQVDAEPQEAPVGTCQHTRHVRISEKPCAGAGNAFGTCRCCSSCRELCAAIKDGKRLAWKAFDPKFLDDRKDDAPPGYFNLFVGFASTPLTINKGMYKHIEL